MFFFLNIIFGNYLFGVFIISFQQNGIRDWVRSTKKIVFLQMGNNNLVSFQVTDLRKKIIAAGVFEWKLYLVHKMCETLLIIVMKNQKVIWLWVKAQPKLEEYLWISFICYNSGAVLVQRAWCGSNFQTGPWSNSCFCKEALPDFYPQRKLKLFQHEKD